MKVVMEFQEPSVTWFYVLPCSDVEVVASLLKRFLRLDQTQRKQQDYEDYGEDDSTDSDNEADWL